MRRAPIVLSATALGLGAVLSFHAREPTPATASGAASAPPATPAPNATATPSAATPSAATPSAPAVKTATGDAIPTQYGNAQVRVTIKDGRITKIEALQLQGNEPKSVQISSSAEPALRQSALTKQSAAIDAVSGATVTSASYEASLQSALDKAGFKAADGSRGTSEVPEVQDDRGRGDGGPPDGP